MENEQSDKTTVSSLGETTDLYLRIKEKYSRNMLAHIMEFSKEVKVIVETGPGLGHFALECKRMGLEYIGFEPNDELRAALESKKIKVVDAFVPPIPLESRTCDVVYASMLLEHFPTFNEASYFTQEVSRVLKDEGHICIVVPNYLVSKEFFYEMDYTHSFVTTKRRVSNLLQDNGIDVIDVQHVIGWFWVRSGFFRHIIRHLINTIMVLFHLGFTTWFFEYLGEKELLWKIRKTFFESLVIIGQKKRK